jgi:sporadic carbohydrate cluster protein (TIGR04323 family)
MNKVRGYIFSRPFMGERVPQHVQNLVIRDYCIKNNLQYLLSATEYAMPGSYLIHEQVMNDLASVDGVAAYSVFQLPENASCRKIIYQQILNLKKTYHFAVEGFDFNDEQGCDRIEMLWQIKKTLPFCYQAI